MSKWLLLGLGLVLAWKAVISIQSGTMTRGGYRHDLVGSEEPIWFWVSVSLMGICGLLLVLSGLLSLLGVRGVSISMRKR